MPVEIDGFAVLGAISRAPDLFAAVRADVTKAARQFVTKPLKAATLDHATLRAIADALGRESFELIVDGLTDAEVKAILGRVDRLNAAIKTAAPHEQHRRLAELGFGAAPVEKVAAPEKPARAAKAAKAPVQRAGNSKAMAAKSRRPKSDASAA